MRALALLCVLLALPSLAQEAPPLELAPLTPPRAPWLMKPGKKKPATRTAPAPKGSPAQKAPPSALAKKNAPAQKAPSRSAKKRAGKASALQAEKPAPELELALPPLVPLAPAVSEKAPAPSAPVAPGPPPLVMVPRAGDLPPPPVVLAPNAVAMKPRAPAAALAAPGTRSRPRWKQPAGIAVAAVGAVAAGAGIVYGVNSRSDLDKAESAFRDHGGVYRQADLTTLKSGNTEARRANLLFVAGGVLLAAGALLIFAF